MQEFCKTRKQERNRYVDENSFRKNNEVFKPLSGSDLRVYKKMKNTFVDGVDLSINEFIDLSKNNNGIIYKLAIGEVTDSFADKFKRYTDIDITNSVVVLRSNDIAHNFRFHSLDGEKYYTRNDTYPIKNDDYYKIADILENFDAVYKETISHDGNLVDGYVLASKTNNGYDYISVILDTTNKNHEIIFKELYKDDGTNAQSYRKSKKQPLQPAYAQESPDLTPNSEVEPTVSTQNITEETPEIKAH